MALFLTSFERILVLFVFIFAGFILVKVKALSKSSSESLAKLENNLFIPALVFTTFCRNFTVEKISTAWRLLLVSSVICVLTMLLASLVVRFVSKDQFTRNIYTYGLVFSNFGFMGNAIVSAVFGEYFLEYLIFTLPLWTMIYVWGVPCLLIPRSEHRSIKSSLSRFVNPMFVCMILGMIFGLTGLNVPKVLGDCAQILGDCMSPVSMLLTGVIVGSMNIKKTLKIPSIYIVTFIRLFVLPLIAMFLLCFFELPHVYIVCIVCSLAMPLGLNIMVIPSGYGNDTSIACASIIVSHLLSAFSIPLMFMLMDRFFF